MINIIKTAIITIIISFLSGLLLNYFTNLGPRILCNVRSIIPKGMNSKENSAYIITVKNPSKKTIHELTINIQSSQRNLKSTDFKITNGLKFDSSINDNILEVYIPFLSNGDNFSVTVCAENQSAVHSKPVIVIRSPENFKEIDSSEQNGILTALLNIPKNIKQVMHKVTGSQQTINKENRDVMPRNKNKKAIIIIVLIILIVIAGVSIRFYSKGTAATNASTPTVKTAVPKQSSGAEGSAGSNATNGTEGGANGTSGTSGSGSNATTSTNASSGTGAAGSNGTTGAGSSGSAGSSGTTGTNSSSSGSANSTTGTNSSGAGVANSTTGAGSSGSANGTSGGASGTGAAGTATNSATGTSGAANGTTAK